MATLRDLGLSEYEQRAYRALLRVGPTTAKELSRSSDLPMGRIYDVLNSLEQLNLVRSQTSGRPKRYMAVEPKTSLNRLLEDKRRELEESMEQYERIVEELMDELESTQSVEQEFWTAEVGEDRTIELLLERLAAADERIIMIVDHRSPQFDLDRIGLRVVEQLEAGVDRGVEISVLMTRELVGSLPTSVGERYRDTLSPHPSFDVRTIEGLDGTFNIIDNVEVVIQVSNPLRSGEVFAVIDLKDRDFATDVYQEFLPRWNEAEPLAF